MSNKYLLLIAPAAREEIENTLRYISADLFNPQAAESLQTALEERFDTLSRFPRSGEPTGFTVADDISVKKVFIKNYTLFYYVTEENKTVNIAHFRYSRSEFSDLFVETDENKD